ncbi:hypothetical protein [Bradyrhizobium sp. SZCCHNRI1009]|nr:hypothetical protein [Bradyrhizobium sp. SZCCHNRI1009]
MKAYLVLDLAVHDFPAFKTYIDAIPAFIAWRVGHTMPLEHWLR